ncbi:MAG: peptidase M28, partial [Sphingomicrobium sp.]
MKLSALPILAALAALAACTTTARESAAPPPPPPEISMATLTTATQILSSDPFEGRAPTTPGEERAVSYIAERFGQAGLQPGNRGSWFQEVPLVETTATPSPLRIAGGNGPLTFNYRSDMVANTYPVQPRVGLENSDIVFVGYGINAPERNWNDYAGVDVRGKTVVILVNDPDWQTQGLDGTFNGRAMTYYGRWTYKFEEAARRGAIAALVVHDTAGAGYGWNVVQSPAGENFNFVLGPNARQPVLLQGWI